MSKLSVISADEEGVLFSSIVSFASEMEFSLRKKDGSEMPVLRRIFRFVFDFMCPSFRFSELLLLSTVEIEKMSGVVDGLLVVFFANVLCKVVAFSVLSNILKVVEALVAVHFLLVVESRFVVVSLLDMSSFCVAAFVEVEVKSILLVVLL